MRGEDEGWKKNNEGSEGSEQNDRSWETTRERVEVSRGSYIV